MDEPNDNLFHGVVTRPVATAMVFLSALVFGWVSYARLPINLMPDISYPTLTVRTTYEGAAPQEIESQVSRPVEEALATLDGLVGLESRSRAGQSDVVLSFAWGTDMASASQSVREQLQTTFLPDDADRPLLLRYDPSAEPFLRLAVGYDPAVLKLDPQPALLLLRDLADRDVKRALEGMDGVAAVRVRGGFEREIRVSVREDWLAARQLTLDAVRQALAAENINLAGGSIYEGDTEYLVRTLNEYRTVEELRTLRLRRADGTLVPITDVATIEEIPRERTVLSHLDRAEAVELEIFKEASANVVTVADTIKAALAAEEVLDEADDEGQGESWGGERPTTISERLPDGVTLTVLDDQAEFIRLAVENLRDAVLQGGLLSIFVLYLFLRDFRATFVIGVTIPISLVMGFAPLYLWDVSINVMSLGGLALGISMLVDNAVVVLENIQRYQEMGLKRGPAAVRGTSEVALAMSASTLTSIAVFAPIAFVEGISGELFGDLALAVVGAQMAGLATGVLLVPTLAALDLTIDEGDLPAPTGWREALAGPRATWEESRAWRAQAGWRRITWPYAAARWLGTAAFVTSAAVAGQMTAFTLRVGLRGTRLVTRPAAWALDSAAARFQSGFDRFAEGYRRVIDVALRRPAAVLGAAVLVFAGSLSLLSLVGSELLPEIHQGRFVVEAALPLGTPLRTTTEVIATAEQIVAAHPDVEAVFTTIGADDRTDTKADEGEHTARLRVTLTPGGDLASREERVMNDLRGQLAAVPRLDVRFSRPALFAFATPMEIIVFGQDLDALRRVGDQIAAELIAAPGLTDVRSSLQRGNPEVQISYDRDRLARLGLDTNTVANQVRDRVQGVQATEIHAGDQRLELRVQLVEAQRQSVGDLRHLNVNPNVVPPIPLDAVATFTEAVGPSEIRRVDQQRAVVISASVVGFDMGSAVDAVDTIMARVPMDDDQTWTLGGQARDLSGSMDEMGFALLLAIFLVYVIMAMTFENLTQPFVILFSVPFGLVGVVLGLLVWGMPFSIVAGLGVVVLAGVVVNNAIVLVDATNQLRSEGMGRREAVADAAVTRLRPILITTSTAVLGLLPLLFGVGAGAEIQLPMAVTVIGGLTTSTLLTLIVIPAVYLLFTRDAAERAP